MRSVLWLLLSFTVACAGSMAPVPEEAPAAPLPTVSAPAPQAATTHASAPSAPAGRTDAEMFDAAQQAVTHGDQDGARATFTELVKRWPASRYVPAAYAGLGDLSFQAGDAAHMTEAEQEYLEVVKYPPPSNASYGHAWYKVAFVRWNRGDGPGALFAFKKVIDYGAQYPQLAGASRLRANALRDVVPVFAQVGNPSRAFPFFRTLAGDDPHAIAMLEALAKTYTTSNNLVDARTVYQDLAVRDAPHACAHGVHARFSVAGANRAAEAAELQKCP